MNTVEEIKELLQKNKKRLDKELQQSKEAVSLIKKSMHSSLSEEEKEKVKIQLLDICKAIPAFALFMLPCLLYTSPSPRDRTRSRMPSSA